MPPLLPAEEGRPLEEDDDAIRMRVPNAHTTEALSHAESPTIDSA